MTAETKDVEHSLEPPIDVRTAPYLKSIESLNISGKDKELLKLYVSNVFFGDPDLKGYSIEYFLEQCAAKEKEENLSSNTVAKRLQEQFSSSLSEIERSTLLEQAPKGSQIEMLVEFYENGNSPSSVNIWREIIAKSGLFTQAPGMELPQTVEELGNLNKVDDAEVDVLFKRATTNGRKITNTIKGTIEAEPIQGYGGFRIQLDESGESTSIVKGDVLSFSIFGFNKDMARRRERELYPDRLVNVWSPEDNNWHMGKVVDRTPADTLSVELTEPFSVTTILNINKRQTLVEVNIGKPQDYNLHDNAPFPELGSSSFEIHPWLYSNIDLTLEAVDPPGGKSPIFRPGNIIRLSGGNIGLVKRVSNQGFAEVTGLDGPNTSETVHWIEMSNEQMPEVLEKMEENALVGARVVLDCSDSPQLVKVSASKNNLILRIKGVYQINDEAHYLLEALPCWLGARKANIPNFRFLPVPVNTFNELRNLDVIRVNETIDVTQELRTKFPKAFPKILNLLEEDGSVVCKIELNDGRKESEQALYFSCLPFGVWVCFDSYSKPELIPASEIKKINPTIS